MRRTTGYAFCALLSLAVVGCGQSPPAAETPQSPILASSENASFPIPSPNPVGDLGLLVTGERNESRVRVGDSADEFRAVLPRPPSVPRAIQELPPQIPAGTKNYAVWGWEFDDRSRGAGALLYVDRIAVAMRQLESLQPSEIERVLAKYRRTFGIPREIQGPRVHYWFWQTRNVTLMVCAFKTGEGGQNLTEAVGDSGVMGGLGMSPERATAQREVLGRIFNSPAQSEDVTNPG